MLGVSRTMQVNIDSPNLGFTYVYFLGGVKNPLCTYVLIIYNRTDSSFVLIIKNQHCE